MQKLNENINPCIYEKLTPFKPMLKNSLNDKT